jgi:hypothetical protein
MRLVEGDILTVRMNRGSKTKANNFRNRHELTTTGGHRLIELNSGHLLATWRPVKNDPSKTPL